MGIFAWIALGCAVGVLARLLLPDTPSGWLARICLGIGGAIVGGWIGSKVWGPGGIATLDVHALIAAAVGAIILVAFHALMTRRRQRARGKAEVHDIDDYRAA